MPWPYLPGRPPRPTRFVRLGWYSDALERRIQRVWCWFRYYHRKTPGIGRFRYDQPGICCDCGIVGSGIGEDGE